MEKLRGISKTYVKTTDAEGKENEKKITIKLDNAELMSTSFEEEITNGILSIAIGNATNNEETINAYLQEASNLAILFNHGELPITYTMEQNRYVVSDIQTGNLVIVGAITGVGMLIAIIFLGIVYRKNGILIGIANVGYVAILLLLIRYTNVIITMEGLVGILISIVLNYIFTIYLLKAMKKETDEIKKIYNKSLFRMLLVLIPALIIGITLCFINWMPIYSFGAITFWGILTIFIYNTVLTRTLLICSTKNQ